LPLKLLNRGAVAEYLAARFDQPAISSPVVSAIYARSEGNPLFMVNATDYLISRQALLREKSSIKLVDSLNQESTPSTIRDLINRRFEEFPAADQELLKVASVAGANFTTAALAAGGRIHRGNRDAL
jgi:predicted ATPase